MAKRLLAQAERTGEAWPFGDLEPSRSFKVIAADPGTKFITRSAAGISPRSPETKYTTMPLADIAAMPVVDLASRHAYLFFWTTGPLLVIGAHIPIMRAWGFEPTAMAFVWIKTRKREAPALFLNARDSFHLGAGYTTRKNAEFCVLGRRGHPPERKSKSVRELIIAPRREHSRKPDEVLCERIERYADGPYLELFSRADRPGWTCWGDQAGKFNERTSP